MISRNEREGRYVGKADGRHKRLHAKGTIPERSYYSGGDCENCGGDRVDGYCADSGRANHSEYGEYYYYEVDTICRDCGHKSGFSDSSI